MVTKNLCEAETTARGLPQSSLRRHIWWSAFVTEQLYFLRYQFEERHTNLQHSAQLDTSTAESLVVEDFHFELSDSSSASFTGYWDRVQQATLFQKKKALFEHVAELTALYPRTTVSLSQSPRGRPISQGCPRREEYFQKVRNLVNQFDDSEVNYNSYMDEETHQSVHVSHLDFYLTYSRVVVALSQVPFRIENKMEYIKRAPKEISIRTIQKMIPKILHHSSHAMQSVARGRLSNGSLLLPFRPMLIASRALVTLSKLPQAYMTKDLGLLRSQCRSLLGSYTSTVERLWMEPTGVPSACMEPDLISAGVTPASLWTISTPLSITSPKCNMSPGEFSQKEVEEQQLMSNFDEMWNKFTTPIGGIHDYSEMRLTK